jgi:hypothetical protein
VSSFRNNGLAFIKAIVICSEDGILQVIYSRVKIHTNMVEYIWVQSIDIVSIHVNHI